MSFQKRRAFGQHFLRDGTVIRAIVDKTLALAKETGVERVLEIGPGHGAISMPLVSEKPSSLAVTFLEKDRVLAANLRAKTRTLPLTDLIEADFLLCEPAQWLGTTDIGVVSNLPYSASTEIVARLSEHPTRIRFMVLMFQREVAQRLRAKVGEADHVRDIGRQTLAIQNFWDVALVCKVPRKAFTPPPKVESEVVVFTPRSAARIPETTKDAAAAEAWYDLVRAAFAHRRKTLSNCLGGNSRWKAALVKSGIDGKKRSETLTWDEWSALFQAGHL